VDAPEGPHFGRPGQPYAAEALTFLSDYILNRRVRAQIYKRDQYNRVVATVFVRKFLFKKDVGLEMLKQGMATVYEAKSGVEWGGRKEIYEAAEAQAKAKKLGIWSGKEKDFESPRAYKSKIQDAEKAREPETTITPQEKKSWWRRWIS
jgi:endonuclease YncB( thermonuclease family)